MLAAGPLGIGFARCRSRPPRPLRVSFTDVTAAVGIDFKHESSPTSNKYLIETMGGGVALLDYDDDGRLDVFFTNGAEARRPDAGGQARPDKSDRRFWNRLYRQNRGRHASPTSPRRPASAARRRATAWASPWATSTTTACPTSTSRATAATSSTATTATARFGTSPSARASAAAGWSTSAGFLDYDNDGDLDLFVCRYVDWTLREQPLLRRDASRATASTAIPTTSRRHERPLRNNGDGDLPRTSPRRPASPLPRQGARRRLRRLRRRRPPGHLRGQRLGAVASSTTTTANGTFPRARPAAPASPSTRTARPSPAWAPTSPTTTTTAGPTSSSPSSRTSATRSSASGGDGSFEYATRRPGVGGATLPYSGWSTRLVDFDNDGWKDLFVAQGHVMDTIELTSPNLHVPAAAAAAAQRVRPLRDGWPPATALRAALGRPRRRLRRPRQRRRRGRGGRQLRRAARYVLRNDGGNRRRWLALRPGRQALEPRRHRLPRQGRRRVRCRRSTSPSTRPSAICRPATSGC